MVSERYLGMPEDMALSPAGMNNASVLTAWKKWAQTAQQNGIPALVQLNHPGRQSALGSGKRGFFDKTLSSSATPLDFGAGIVPTLMRALVFGTPKEMTHDDIDQVIARFEVGAQLAQKAGFKGVELHGAHGYLLGKFWYATVVHRTWS
jgi:2,4-dienoyl-CoA reductase-like NADH-dependent reductase (Old Yellow Enzyme family)